MIHRVVLGSIERLIGVITERVAGAFPVWLAPVQVMVMPITDRTKEYSQDSICLLYTSSGFTGLSQIHA